MFCSAFAFLKCIPILEKFPQSFFKLEPAQNETIAEKL